jgi:hypothetical protein
MIRNASCFSKKRPKRGRNVFPGCQKWQKRRFPAFSSHKMAKRVQLFSPKSSGLLGSRQLPGEAESVPLKWGYIRPGYLLHSHGSSMALIEIDKVYRSSK